MLQELINFFYNLFIGILPDSELNFETLQLGIKTGQVVDGENVFVEMSFTEYFATLASIISLILIVVLCCLFVYKIIKLVGGLITR